MTYDAWLTELDPEPRAICEDEPADFNEYYDRIAPDRHHEISLPDAIEATREKLRKREHDRTRT
ncbi:MAG: hypothetical protein WC322_03360 [Candidatus Paceibacterota bacterium]|jgi:hypothetical protein